MSSEFCQPCHERLSGRRKRLKGERCAVPACHNYAVDLKEHHVRVQRRKLKGIVGA